MVRLPTSNAAVASVATPEPLTVTFVRGEPSTLKVIVPVRVPAPGATGLTVAVNVTDWPNTVGFSDDATVVTVSARLTVWATAVEVLVLKLTSPAYTAVIE